MHYLALTLENNIPYTSKSQNAEHLQMQQNSTGIVTSPLILKIRLLHV